MAMATASANPDTTRLPASTVTTASATRHDIDQEYAADDLANGKTIGEGALIEMSAMRLPESVAAGQMRPKQRDRRIGDVIERQDERRSRMAVAGELEQEPTEQSTDRQAADIAEKQLATGLLNGAKPSIAPEQRGCHQRREHSERAEQARAERWRRSTAPSRRRSSNRCHP